MSKEKPADNEPLPDNLDLGDKGPKPEPPPEPTETETETEGEAEEAA